MIRSGGAMASQRVGPRASPPRCGSSQRRRCIMRRTRPGRPIGTPHPPGGHARWRSAAILPAVLALLSSPAGTAGLGAPLDPLSLTKYFDPLPIPATMPPAGPNYYEVGAWQIRQQLHRQLPPTTLYAFGPTAETASWPAPTFEAVRDVPISVHWTNHLPSPSFLAYAIDPTLHM